MISKGLLPILFSILTILLAGCRSLDTSTADAQLDRGEYYDAQRNYRKVYNRLTKRNQRARRGEIARKLAICHTRLNQPARAALMLRNAIRYGQDDPQITLMLGQSLQREGKYAEAMKIYEEYTACHGLDAEATAGIEGCKLALGKKNGTRYRVKRAKTINMHRSDYSPAFAGSDFDRIYFTSTNNHSSGREHSGITGMKNGDIWMSARNERGEWIRPEPAEGNINSEHDEGAAAFSPDGRTMYFTRSRQEHDRTTGLEIWMSQRRDAQWDEPVPFEFETCDTICSYAHPSVSPDGRWLYFASDIPGGQGGYDLWRVSLDRGGAPVNLGSSINTPGNEMFPSVRDNDTLYFSSDGHPGLGGLDIFKATRNGTDWKVINMLSPINSEADDFGIVFGKGESGFFSSNRNDARGYDHIYEFELPDLSIDITGYVRDTEEYAVPGAMIRIVGNDGSNRRTHARDDGSFSFTLNPGVRYAMLASAEGYMNARQEFTSDNVEEDALYEVIFTLAPVNRPIVIENIFYDYNKASLRPESREALDSLANVMKENPTITIRLSSHTDRIGSDHYNLRLSELRAESVVDYLINKAGIDPRRLSTKGYGKSQPKTVTPRLFRQFPQFQEGTALTADYIDSLENEQDRTIADQINRRTEFEITSVDFY